MSWYVLQIEETAVRARRKQMLPDCKSFLYSHWHEISDPPPPWPHKYWEESGEPKFKFKCREMSSDKNRGKKRSALESWTWDTRLILVWFWEIEKGFRYHVKFSHERKSCMNYIDFMISHSARWDAFPREVDLICLMIHMIIPFACHDTVIPYMLK